MPKIKLPNYIAIEGPIGVGKTSLAKKIAKEYDYDLCLEKPDENPFLGSFYNDQQKYAFSTQMYFVMQRSQQINQFIFEEVKSKFYEKYPKPDLLIYLQASPKRIFDQVKMRGKEYEEKINLEYLEKICSAYSEFFFSYSESPLLVLNVDDVDFVSNQMDFNQIIDCVKKNIIGREFINLSPSFF